jgi:cation:H+ antiporter
MSPLLAFVLSAAVVMLAGTRLSRHGETIAERTGLGGAWTGAILLAAATSLPELSTHVHAVQGGYVTMAVSGLFGASMSNMLILAFADLLVLQQRMLARIAINQTLLGSLAIALTAIAAAGVLTGDALMLGPIGWAPILIAMGYLSGMRLLYISRPQPAFETMGHVEDQNAHAYHISADSLQRALIVFVLWAGVVFVAANTLADSAAAVADDFGLSRGFVGVTLIALTTTLPEVSVAVASVRRGAYDLAVGNLLGANCMHMVLLLVLDIVHGSGSVLAMVDPATLLAAMFAILLMALTLIEVLARSERRVWLIEPDALLRIGMYLLGVVLVFRIGG